MHVYLLICYSVDSDGGPKAGATTVTLRVWLLQVLPFTIASSFPSVMLGQPDDYSRAVPLPGSLTSTPSPLPLGQTHHKKELGPVDATEPSGRVSGSSGDFRLHQLTQRGPVHPDALRGPAPSTSHVTLPLLFFPLLLKLFLHPSRALFLTHAPSGLLLTPPMITPTPSPHPNPGPARPNNPGSG